MSLEDWPDPKPAGDEVVVRVTGAGVCHTDVHIQDGLLDRADEALDRVRRGDVAGRLILTP